MSTSPSSPASRALGALPQALGWVPLQLRVPSGLEGAASGPQPRIRPAWLRVELEGRGVAVARRRHESPGRRGPGGQAAQAGTPCAGRVSGGSSPVHLRGPGCAGVGAAPGQQWEPRGRGVSRSASLWWRRRRLLRRLGTGARARARAGRVLPGPPLQHGPQSPHPLGPPGHFSQTACAHGACPGGACGLSPFLRVQGPFHPQVQPWLPCLQDRRGHRVTARMGQLSETPGGWAASREGGHGRAGCGGRSPAPPRSSASPVWPSPARPALHTAQPVSGAQARGPCPLPRVRACGCSPQSSPPPLLGRGGRPRAPLSWGPRPRAPLSGTWGN